MVNPDWNGRVQVTREKDGVLCSYKPDEIEYWTEELSAAEKQMRFDNDGSVFGNTLDVFVTKFHNYGGATAKSAASHWLAKTRRNKSVSSMTALVPAAAPAPAPTSMPSRTRTLLPRL